MTNVAVATTSQLAADAAEEVAAAGGNAVDCALAASLLTMNTEPGVCALAGSSFITIWPDGGEPVVIDGNVAVPGAGLSDEQCGQGAVAVSMEYGGASADFTFGTVQNAPFTNLSADSIVDLWSPDLPL